MNLFALEKGSGKTVFAEHAQKQTDYACSECGSLLRLRSGQQRLKHFYHVHAQRICRSQGKSMTHLQIQFYFFQLLSQEDCILEKPFAEIKRIADIFWISKKIIFEIQCSPISKEEVECRNRDYASLGYQVVWIMHDRTFNQWRLSSAEGALLKIPHYYTNMNAEGEGYIYDQYAYIENGRRKKKLEPLLIELPKLCRNFSRKAEKDNAPLIVNLRLKEWPFTFAGDLLSLALEKSDHPYLIKAKQIEKEFQRLLYKYENFFQKWMIRPYQILLHTLLERTCR